MTAVDLTLDADHAGLPVGTRILIGYAEAAATAPQPTVAKPVVTESAKPSVALPPTIVAPVERPASRRGLGIPSDMARPGTTGPSPLVQIAPEATKRLTAAGYVFPVYGPTGFGDTFGAPRATTNWHHGQDLFAALGAPVLAVADGTVFSVGWNRVGGNRLWLRDRDGNEFYYAHLAAFSPLAVDSGRVHAGDVVGFVGNTGDAETTPYHLHFEIHPSSLLFLGYDCVVNPYPYLQAWQHAADVDFPSAAVWAPTLRATGRAPAAGAVLLQSTDISVANGLDPGSLARAIAPAAGRLEHRSRAAEVATYALARRERFRPVPGRCTRTRRLRHAPSPSAGSPGWVNGLKKHLAHRHADEDQEDVAEAVAVRLPAS